MDIETGRIVQYKKNKGFESIPRELLQDENLSLEAIGLLSHICSLPETWKIYKTQLYKKFKKNKRTSVQRIWKELVETGYILEFRKREGKKYVYEYVYSMTPFSTDEIFDVIDSMSKTGLEIWSADFEQSKLDCSKRADNKLLNKEIDYKEKDTMLNTKANPDERLLNSLPELLQGKTFLNEQSIQNIQTFSNSPKEAYSTIGIILRAKNDIQKEEELTLIIDSNENWQHELQKTIMNVYFKFKTDSTLKNFENYLYISVKNCIKNFALEERNHRNGNFNKPTMKIPMHDWSISEYDV
jgi:predicted transcriptional regulator